LLLFYSADKMMSNISRTPLVLSFHRVHYVS